MKLQTLLMLGLLAAGNSQAQQNNNQYFHEQQRIQNQNHAAEQARQGYMTQQQQMQQQQQQQPTGYWEKTWGAIAPSPVGGVLGTAVGASTKEEAERLALSDCKAKGGGACQVDLVYHNQCAVMVVGDKRLRLQGAESIEAASELAIFRCEESDTNCEVYYSACTEPIFHKYKY